MFVTVLSVIGAVTVSAWFMRLVEWLDKPIAKKDGEKN